MGNDKRASFAALESGRGILTEATAESDEHRHGTAVVFGHLNNLITLRCARTNDQDSVKTRGLGRMQCPALVLKQTKAESDLPFPLNTTATSCCHRMMQPTRNPPSGWVLQQREREKPPALEEAILPVARPLPSGSCAWAAPSGPPEPREQPREQPEELPAERGMDGEGFGFRRFQARKGPRRPPSGTTAIKQPADLGTACGSSCKNAASARHP